MTKQRACLCALILLLLPALLPASDTLLIHGHIYTGNAKAPWGQAIAITGTRIDAVGSDQEILARRQPKTQVIDLQGRTVIPGISDSHTHMWFGAMALRGINLPRRNSASRRIPPTRSSRKSKATPQAIPRKKYFSAGRISA